MKLDFGKIINKNSCKLAVLVDPDKFNPGLITDINPKKVGLVLVGGSKLELGSVEKTVSIIKKLSKAPVVLFPGDENQLTKKADGIFILSLVSGRNPDFLIGKHVKAAMQIKKYKLETIPVAYILFGGNKKSTTQKVTGTEPIHSKQELINTVIASELLGFKAIYLEAGSGAKKAISTKVIREISRKTSLPLIVGGGIKTTTQAKGVKDAGANLIVVGNALETNPGFIFHLQNLF